MATILEPLLPHPPSPCSSARQPHLSCCLPSFPKPSDRLSPVANSHSPRRCRANSYDKQTNWIQVRGAGADIFFRDPFVLDENISVEFSSPSSSSFKSVEDLGSPQEAGEKVLKQYLTEFMSTRLGVRRESNVLHTSSRVADDGRIYYQVEVNIKSYANNNELAVLPQDRVVKLEWDRRYLSVLGVENNRLYELRLQTPENVFVEEENDLRQVMDSFRVNKVVD
ncbi:psbP domain-containing protein 1, chloroplastic isoform X3 [Malania oleifera]|uniref:psbP domain-containing protein 1, chloroplastic isoform X3 n=1 Tax=Malania oleifera TaxID=397392 RepID=UPI0025ADF72C|nr:psbP domain-containing protein 1, chloroplastic isoform X3 [Malania oleifera]